MAKAHETERQSGPVTTGTLAQPHPAPAAPTNTTVPHLSAPSPPVPVPRPAEKVGPAARTVREWRVQVRHTPLTRFKSLVVKAADEAGAWQAYQEELARLLLCEREGDGGKKALDAFRDWLKREDVKGVPAAAEIVPEDDHQQKRAQARASKPVAIPRT